MRMCGVIAASWLIATSAAAAELPAGIGLRDTELGRVFTDAGGMTLYVYADRGRCSGRVTSPPATTHPLLKVYAEAHATPSCLQQWPAAEVAEGAVPTGGWTIIKSDDGKNQWAYKGRPVHRFYRDFLPGDVSGAPGEKYFRSGGARLEWFLATPDEFDTPPGIRQRSRAGTGTILASDDGRVLYVLGASPRQTGGDSLRKVAPGCSEDCREQWAPLPASESARGFGDWTVARMADGTPVWAYRGNVLYSYRGDYDAGDINGIGINSAKLVVLRPAPETPKEFTKVVTPIGLIYGDSKRMTVYEFSCELRGAPGSSPRYLCDGWNDDVAHREQFCEGGIDKCAEMWRPVVAPANMGPKGAIWSVAVIPDPKYPLRWEPATPESLKKPGAIKVWTLYGRPLYTSTRDHEPGDYFASAIHHQAGQRWSEISAGELTGGGAQ